MDYEAKFMVLNDMFDIADMEKRFEIFILFEMNLTLQDGRERSPARGRLRPGLQWRTSQARAMLKLRLQPRFAITCHSLTHSLTNVGGHVDWQKRPPKRRPPKTLFDSAYTHGSVV